MMKREREWKSRRAAEKNSGSDSDCERKGYNNYDHDLMQRKWRRLSQRYVNWTGFRRSWCVVSTRIWTETTAHQLTRKHGVFFSSLSLSVWTMKCCFLQLITVACSLLFLFSLLKIETPKGRVQGAHDTPWGSKRDRLFPVIIEQRCFCVLQILFLTTGFWVLSFCEPSCVVCLCEL